MPNELANDNGGGTKPPVTETKPKPPKPVKPPKPPKPPVGV